MTVFINHRLEDANGTFLGVTGVGLELTDIAESLKKYQDLFDHKIYMIDRNGLIQIHPEKSLVATTNIQDIEGISDVSESILSTKEEVKILEYKDSQSAKTISIRYIPEFDWFLIVEKDHNSSLVVAKRSLFQNVIIGIIITILISFTINQVFKKHNQRLEYLASSDELTGLFNRRAFLKILQKEVYVVERYKYSSSLLMIDIDDFKSVNDHYGHFIGDNLLTEIVKAVKSSLRTSDFLGRWGGDELIAYLFRADSKEAFQIAKRIQKSVENTHIGIHKKDIHRTVCIGITTFTDPSPSTEELIKQADKALIRSKKEGENKIRVSS